MSSSVYIYDDGLVIDGNFSVRVSAEKNDWYIDNNSGEASSGWYIGTLRDFLSKVFVGIE